MQQEMLLNCRRCGQVPLEFANPAQAVLQRCQYSSNIFVQCRAMRQWLHNVESFVFAAALWFD
jgi:hypothetical protein